MIGVSCCNLVFIFLNVVLLIIERERETEHEQGRIRERETQNPKRAPGSEPQHRARRGVEPMNVEIMT